MTYGVVYCKRSQYPLADHPRRHGVNPCACKGDYCMATSGLSKGADAGASGPPPAVEPADGLLIGAPADAAK